MTKYVKPPGALFAVNGTISIVTRYTEMGSSSASCALVPSRIRSLSSVALNVNLINISCLI